MENIRERNQVVSSTACDGTGRKICNNCHGWKTIRVYE